MRGVFVAASNGREIKYTGVKIIPGRIQKGENKEC